jgi:Xaa-Pro aminopeptidase
MLGFSSVLWAVVGSGTDITKVHYVSNRHQISQNELVVFDFAASLHHLP